MGLRKGGSLNKILLVCYTYTLSFLNPCLEMHILVASLLHSCVPAVKGKPINVGT